MKSELDTAEQLRRIKKIRSELVVRFDKTVAVIVAGGSSNRMNGTDKLWAGLNNIPVLIHSIMAFQNSNLIQGIVVVTKSENIDRVKFICKKYSITKLFKVAESGECRSESVLRGLLSVESDTGFVAIHDGARPLVTVPLINKVIEAAKIHSAAIPMVEVKDTVKYVSDGFIKSTPARKNLYAAQTPQAFNFSNYLKAIENNTDALITDDSTLFELAGLPVKFVEGNNNNIKITTPEDLIIANILYKRMEDGWN